MIQNYIKAALRSLLREKGNTFINIAGLSLGITGSLVLFLIIQNGNSFDAYHTHHNRIYRVVSQAKGNTGDTFTPGIPTVLPEAFAHDFKEAEAVALTSYRRDNLITIPQTNGTVKKYEEANGVVFTQPSFFKIFDRKMIVGTPEKALDEPQEAIISKKWALKYFGKENASGAVISYENMDYVIKAVMEDYPDNTDLPFNLMLSSITIQKTLDERGWGSISDSDNCYFLLNERATITSLEERIPDFITKYFGTGMDNPNHKTILFQPLAKLHSDMHFANYNIRLPEAAQLVLAVIGIFLLLTACINFINLTTAEAIKRTKEVGIRKVLGSTRGQLIYKFVSEAFLVTIIAVLISLAGAQILLSFINPFMDLSLTLRLSADFSTWFFLIGITIVVSLLSGLYPAIVVSGFRPAQAMKNQINQSSTSSYAVRRGLVVAQFFISQFFIIGTIVVTRQMNFIQQQNPGFAKDAIITVPIPVGEYTLQPNGTSKMRALKEELMQLRGVEKASLSSSPPSSRGVIGTTFSVVGKEDQFETQVKQVDGDYINVFAIEILEGTNLHDQDTMNGILVNEKLVTLAGFKNKAEILGREISLWDHKLRVIGVTKDFNTTSLSKPIEPVVLFNQKSGYHALSIKLNPADMQATIHEVQSKWEATYPEFIFSYSFLDQQIRDLYKGDQKNSALVGVFAFIAIFIGCLGLFGLVTFMANQKTKEIGVRKALGASVEDIVLLFSKEFARLIVIGFLLAAPVAGYLMHELLQQFAYRITLGPGIFLSGLGVTFLIAFITVGYRSISAATADPVKSLRSE